MRCYLDDGTQGLPHEAPFDVILVAAGAETVPPAFPEQLAEGGRIIIPIGPDSRQQLMRISRRGELLDREELGSFGFVPLIAD